jgi:hypothetical protein
MRHIARQVHIIRGFYWNSLEPMIHPVDGYEYNTEKSCICQQFVKHWTGDNVPHGTRRILKISTKQHKNAMRITAVRGIYDEWQYLDPTFGEPHILLLALRFILCEMFPDTQPNEQLNLYVSII